MDILFELRNSRKNSKLLVQDITNAVLKDNLLAKQLINILKTGSKVERGTVSDVMKHVSSKNPGLLSPFIDDLIESVNSDVPRVMWGVPEALGNMAKDYPVKVGKAVTKLLVNTKSDSTVVKWCAAFALSEILKYNVNVRKTLLPKVEELIKTEKNNGVKNVYVKAVKELSKN